MKIAKSALVSPAHFLLLLNTGGPRAVFVQGSPPPAKATQLGGDLFCSLLGVTNLSLGLGGAELTQSTPRSTQ